MVGARSKLAAGAGHNRHYNRPLIGHRSVLLALRGKTQKISYKRNNATANHSLGRSHSDLLLILED